jgi:hypothetical protein
MTGNTLILALVSIGIFFGIGYSVRPLEFKTKGMAHGLSLATSAFFLPMAFLVVVITGGLDILTMFFLLGFSLAMYSLEFGNQALDHFEDRRMGYSTPTVKYGVRNSIGFALVLLPIGFLFTVVPLATLALNSYHDIHPMFTDWMIVLLVSTIVALGFAKPAIGLLRLYRGFTPPKRADDLRSLQLKRGSIAKALKAVDHPGWQLSGALGVVLVCGLLFGGMFVTFPGSMNEPIINKVPEVKIRNNPDMIVNIGEEVTFNAEVIDDSESLSYTWNFGDGTGLSGGRASNHTFHKVGVYNVTFTVFDGDNRVSDWINLTVTDLFFSKLDFWTKRYLTFTRVYFDFNVTNDKDLKHKDELIVKIFYQNALIKSQGLDHKLDPAMIWHKDNYMDIPLDREPMFRVILLHDLGNEQVVVEDRWIQAE